jgi:hypothetical protein
LFLSDRPHTIDARQRQRMICLRPFERQRQAAFVIVEVELFSIATASTISRWRLRS